MHAWVHTCHGACSLQTFRSQFSSLPVVSGNRTFLVRLAWQIHIPVQPSHPPCSPMSKAWGCHDVHPFHPIITNVPYQSSCSQCPLKWVLVIIYLLTFLLFSLSKGSSRETSSLGSRNPEGLLSNPGSATSRFCIMGQLASSTLCVFTVLKYEAILRM